MTLQHDPDSDLFGLASTMPRPGWVVLDAARDHRFTGELLFDSSPPVRVYFDRGDIYMAERVTDPSLGSRLVDAGAITTTQFELGSVRIGRSEHLGRLFERVTGLDRDAVIIAAELLSEECLGWLAPQRISDVGSAPYRHHESGMHLWHRSEAITDPVPGASLPAPTALDSPVSLDPPVPQLVPGDEFLEGLIEWDEPAWLDEASLDREVAEADDGPAPLPAGPTVSEALPDAASEADSNTIDEPLDWVDRLAQDGLPQRDPLVSPKPLPHLPVEPIERFELVWPSGEIDEDFGAVESVVGAGHDPDEDRVGATARLSRQESADSSASVATEAPTAGGDNERRDDEHGDEHDDDGDQVVLAVRRAVASIGVGSLAARQRLAEDNGALGTTPTGGVPAPGRVAVRSGRNDWSRRTVTRSVFDEPAPAPQLAEPDPPVPTNDPTERRAGALRRLITSLRR